MIVIEHVEPFGGAHSRAAFLIEWARLTGQPFPVAVNI